VRRAVIACLLVVATALMCAGLISAAALVPAPPAAIPAIVLTCVACPLVVASDFTAALAVLRLDRRQRRDRRQLSRLLRELERLPEVEHPLDR
jgi:hypothetical protein